MSPEQIAGKKVDGRSDLYSLGVMLYQMLTGTLPFRGDSMAELMYKIANEEAPDFRVVRPDLPERLAQVVGMALAKKPDARYQDGDAFARDLRAVLASLSGEAALAAATPAGAVRFPAPAAGGDPTVAYRAVAPASGGPKPGVFFEATVPAGNAFAASVPAAGAPGYDAAQKDVPAQAVQFEKTAVMNNPGAPVPPSAGEPNAGQEP
jgi:serine/threonine-protein kinase